MRLPNNHQPQAWIQLMNDPLKPLRSIVGATLAVTLALAPALAP
ncbi:MAG: hypothetical protein ACJ8BW_22685 [Ktedonobacteraceae bacterium]